MSEVYKALHSVMKKVGYVQKEGKVSFGNTKYNYAGEADLIKALRPAMIEAGLIMYCKSIETVSDSFDVSVVENKGYQQVKTTARTVNKYSFVIAHVDGETMNVTAIGEGIDSGDKASYKAATGALKYALRQSFIIETGDDPDKTSSEELQTNVLDTDTRRDALKQFVIQFKQKCDTATYVEHIDEVVKYYEKYLNKMKKDFEPDYDALMAWRDDKREEIKNKSNV